MKDAAIQGFISGAVFGGMGRGAKSGSDLCKYVLTGFCTFGGTYTGGKAGIELSNGNKKLAALYTVESALSFFGAYATTKIGSQNSAIDIGKGGFEFKELSIQACLKNLYIPNTP